MEIELALFRLQNQQFGIEVKSINRILTSSLNKKTQKIHFEDVEIPTIDLTREFNLNNHKKRQKKEIILVEFDGIKKGLLVDEVLRILKVNLDKVKVIPSLIKTTAPKDHFWAVAQVEEELILLLDIRKL
ncbi:MAG: chemotaxis protein CheW [bacterium]